MRILFIGESWHIHMIHSKGYDSFTSSKYEEGANHLLSCLRSSGVEIDYMPAHVVQINFPKTVQELSVYDAIVISDIGSNTFLLQNKTFYNMEIIPNALELIKEYVAQGGGLLMIGGYLSFTGIEAKANYKNTVLAEVLPVEMLDCDDRVELPQGCQPVTTDNKHNITAQLTQWPPLLGYNKLISKPESTALVEINGDPLLVLGDYKNGRVACFASDCAPHWGSPQFMQWEHYTSFWCNILNSIKKL
ncbi:glutamine amidotransferase [Buttiauxella noackiae]|uniref:glutamine amidotransferase n=1 Tax=Buttiauxella noackiae TaxID=82992 RepID=UPI0028D41BB0|nr:glutamine amidotransferase [Buttiauxella noackiae]